MFFIHRPAMLAVSCLTEAHTAHANTGYIEVWISQVCIFHYFISFFVASRVILTLSCQADIRNPLCYLIRLNTFFHSTSGCALRFNIIPSSVKMILWLLRTNKSLSLYIFVSALWFYLVLYVLHCPKTDSLKNIWSHSRKHVKILKFNVNFYSFFILVNDTHAELHNTFF